MSVDVSKQNLMSPFTFNWCKILIAVFALYNTVGVDIALLGTVLLIMQPLIATIMLLTSNYKYKIFKIAILLAFILFMFLCGIVNGSGYGNLLTWLTLSSMIVILSESVSTKEQVQTIFAWICIAILLVLIYFYRREGVYYVSPQGNRLNPNGYSLNIYFLGVFFFAWITKFSKSKKRKIIMLLGMCIILYLLYQTGARTSLGAFLLVLGLCFVCRKSAFLQVRQTFCFVNIISLIAGIIFPILYIKASEYFNGEIIIMGKNLFSGREDVWIDFFEMYRNNWFFGFSNEYIYIGKFTSVHNTYLALLGNCGLLTYILWGIFLLCKNYSHNSLSKGDNILYAGWYGALFIGFFETVWQSTFIYLFIAFLFLNKTREENTND